MFRERTSEMHPQHCPVPSSGCCEYCQLTPSPQTRIDCEAGASHPPTGELNGGRCGDVEDEVSDLQLIRGRNSSPPIPAPHYRGTETNKRSLKPAVSTEESLKHSQQPEVIEGINIFNTVDTHYSAGSAKVINYHIVFSSRAISLTIGIYFRKTAEKRLSDGDFDNLMSWMKAHSRNHVSHTAEKTT